MSKIQLRTAEGLFGIKQVPLKKVAFGQSIQLLLSTKAKASDYYRLWLLKQVVNS